MSTRRLLIWLVTSVGLACNGTSVDDAGNDASASNDSGSEAAEDSGSNDASTDVSVVEAGAEAGYDGGVVNGCTTFVDDTADGGILVGPTTQPPAQYVPNCVHIKVGQSATWTANFGDHPLEAYKGTMPSPIVTTSSGTSVTFTFSTPGTYGYQCQFHPFAMFGAVEVTY
jgi:plastocyanin